jgi:nickel/cobalt exporter
VKRLLLLSLALAALVAPATASAHPLGNFTVNRYSEIALSGNRVYVLYVLDMAEIPAFEERNKARRLGEERYAAALAARIGRGLQLTLAGEERKIRLVRKALAFPPGQAGLKTLRLEALYETAPLHVVSPTHLEYRDLNFRGRIGWREIVVRASDGTDLRSSSARSESLSDRLRTYPKDLLQSPPDVSDARASFVPGSGPGTAPALGSRAELERRVAVGTSNDGFARLISEEDLSAGFILLSIFVAVFWGAAHAFSPGHGKSIVAAYLVGSRGTPRHAVLLGLTVTVTHTIGVFALGLVTLALSEFIVPEQLYPWLNLVSALLVLAVGVAVLRWRVGAWRRLKTGGRDGHAHHHPSDHRHHHHHRHHHGHPHDREPGIGIRGILGVGISGGIIPCPTALVVLLAAISLHRVGYGLVLIVAFSIGLAAAMTSIGLLAVSAKRLFSRMKLESGAFSLLPAVSALVIIGLGLVMTARAIPTLT